MNPRTVCFRVFVCLTHPCMLCAHFRQSLLCQKEMYPQKDFAFVVGGDMLISFETWHRAEELMKLIPFIAFKRNDIDDSEFLKCVDTFLKKGMNLTVKEDLIPKVSSSEFRKSTLKELLPEKVFNFIKERGIYGV